MNGNNNLWLKRFSQTCHFTSAEDTGMAIIPMSWSAPDPWSTGPTAHIEVIDLKLVLIIFSLDKNDTKNPRTIESDKKLPATVKTTISRPYRH
jgi:hypothetical protein